MCLKIMDDKNTKDSSKFVNKNLLELFWNLTDKNSERRIKTCLNILQILCQTQNQVEQSDEISKDLKYCFERLIKGLASSRDAARLGYSLLLTEILKQFPILPIEDVLESMKQHLAFTPKQEKRDIVFGQLFAYSSIVRSERLANHSHLSFVVLGIYDLWQGRTYIVNACYEILKILFDQLSSEKFAADLWPHLKKKFSESWEKCSSDNLWLLLLSIRLFPEAIGEKFLKKHFNNANIFSVDNFDNLKKLIKQTTSCVPKIHPLCSEVSIYCASRKDKEVWNALVDDSLFNGEQIEKCFVGFEMVKCALSTTNKKKIVKFILSPNFCSLFVRSYINSKSPLNSAATQLADFLTKYVVESKDSELQNLILKVLLQSPGATSLDKLLREKEVSFMIQNLLPESIQMYCEILKSIAISKDMDGEEKEGIDHAIETRRGVAIAHIANLVSHAKMSSDVEWKMNIIKFLFLHSFFSVTKATTEILNCEQETENSAAFRNSCRSAFFKSIAFLYQRAENQSPMQHSLQCLMILVEYADQLMAATDNCTPHFLIEQVQESWLKMKHITHKLKKQYKKDGKVNETNAFLALFLELGFNLFHDFKHISEVLEELEICCKKALSGRKQETEDDEPPWVSVLVDILLSLLSKNSHPLRRLVTSVFQLLCPLITQEALHQILSVINPDNAAEEAMLIDESDQEAEEVEFESGDSSSDESDNLNEPDNSNVDEKFRKKVKDALGSAADDDDASDVESVVMSDSEMFKLDEALSEAFRERVQTGPTKLKVEDKTMLDFRTKCLDLIVLYIKSEPPMHLVLQCIEPLLSAYEFSHKNELQKHLLHKLVSTIETLTKLKKFQHLDNIEKSEIKNLLEMLIAKCQKEFNLEVAKRLYSLCTFVVQCYRKLENNKSPKKSSKTPSYIKMYLSTLEDFAKGHSSHVFPQFFTILMESCPDLAWYFVENCQIYAFDKTVRMYRRTQCLGLLFEALKLAKRQETVNTNQWTELCKQLIPITAEALKEIIQESNFKPVLLTELLDILYTCHIILEEKTSQSILEIQPDLVSHLSSLSKEGKNKFAKKGKATWRKLMNVLGGNVKFGRKQSCNSNDEIAKDIKEKVENEIENSNDLETSVNLVTKKRKSSTKKNKVKKHKTATETVESS